MTGQEALNGWKAIAGHFGRDERTVMRWAEQRGLPVRRVPGGGKSTVYALIGELDAWLANASDAPPPAPPAPVPERSEPAAPDRPAVAQSSPWWRGARVALLGLGVLLAAGLAWLAVRGPPAAVHAARPFHDPAAEQSYLQASYDLNLRTPASLHRAIDGFGRSIAADPAAAPAYAGLGESYLLLREYTDFADDAAFPRADAAAAAAVAIDPDLASAHRVLGFVAFWYSHDIPRARSEFGRAIALDPRDPLTRHWYASALTGNAEYAAALTQMEEARRLDPQSAALLADFGLLTYLSGRHDAGLALLRQLERDEPTQSSAPAYLADLALLGGDGPGYLGAAAIVARLRGDPAATLETAAEAAAFRRGGMRALLALKIDRQAGLVGRTHRNYYALARLYAVQGQESLALDMLRAASAHHEMGLAGLSSDIAFHALLDHPGFDRLAPRGTLAP